MSYFVTGATGFIGRHLVERLLEREGTIHVLVREGSREKLDALVERWGQPDRIHPVVGDLTAPRLGLDAAQVDELRGQVDHFFHLAAIYDMTAPEDRNVATNVGGTEHAVELANELEVGHFHHTSSIAAAGMFQGLFREDYFDEGQKLDHPYHRTKFESEKLVREQARAPWRVYRPGIVVGHSQTGEMDKVDGPYYFFKALQKARHLLPEWFPLVGPELGYTNIVPVDFVAAAMDHIAHEEGLDGQAFHLTNPRSQRSGEVLNVFARAAHAPQMTMRIDRRLTDALPKGVVSMALRLPALKGVRKAVLADVGIPDDVVSYVGLTAQFDTRDTERALRGTGIEVPELASYADRLWDYYERVLDPDLYRDRSFEGAVNGKVIVITGGSSGIGEATAKRIAGAGGIPVIVARGQENLDRVKAEIEEAGGTCSAYSADLASPDAIGELVERVLGDHPRVDMVVNNAGRSIRRSVYQSLDRFHDYERTMQLNYFGTIKLIMSLLPHMREQGGGHFVNVSSIGVQANPPRFSAYVASKSALDGFTDCISSEVVGDGITFTTIHMPLVRTPMISPTKLYDSFPTASPEEAADMVCEALRSKPKHIATRLGTFATLANALAPKAVDQILHMAYKVFPDSMAATGSSAGGGDGAKPSGEALVLANIMRGVHW